MSDEMKKSGEVARLQYLIDIEGITFEELAELSDASVRTVKNTIYENKPIGMKLLRGLQKKKGVSLDWLLLGTGEMYAHAGSLQKNIEGSINYGKDSTVVTTGVNNGHIVTEGGSNTYNNYQGGRGLRLCEFVRWWMESHDADDQAWLEKQLERAVPEYLEWKNKNE